MGGQGLVVRWRPVVTVCVMLFSLANFIFFLVRVSNAWLNSIAPALERKKDALYLNCGLKEAT